METALKWIRDAIAVALGALLVAVVFSVLVVLPAFLMGVWAAVAYRAFMALT